MLDSVSQGSLNLALQDLALMILMRGLQRGSEGGNFLYKTSIKLNTKQEIPFFKPILKQINSHSKRLVTKKATLIFQEQPILQISSVWW